MEQQYSDGFPICGICGDKAEDGAIFCPYCKEKIEKGKDEEED